jgi:hypothetical protein
MGWDIHAVIEYRSPRSAGWQAIADGEFDLAAGRTVIEALVNSSGDPLLPPRGLPADYSRTVLKLYFLAVFDDQGRVPTRICPPILRSAAEEAVAAGHSRYYEFGGNSQALINEPEWFSPGWLRRQEIEDLLLLHEVPSELVTPQLRAGLAVMRELEAAFGVENVRLVFWLDS